MSTLDDQVAAVAAFSDNVISRTTLLRLKASNRWVQAALMAAGEGAGVSHRTGARLRGLQGAEDHNVIDITIPDDRDVDLRIVGHEHVEDLPTIHVWRSRRGTGPKSFADGLPATCIERMLVDYSAVASRLQVERAVEDVLNRNLVPETRLWEGLVRHGGRGVTGTRRLRHVLTHRPKGRPAKSILEIFVGQVLERAGMPGGIRNYPVAVEGKNYEIDRAWPDRMVGLEADSKAWHGTATASARDSVKTAALELLGYTVVRTNWDETVNHPERLVAKLELAFCEGSPVHNTEIPSQRYRAGRRWNQTIP